MNDSLSQAMGEPKSMALVPVVGPVAVDTFSGRVHLEWDAQAGETPLGQLPFLMELL